MFVGFMSPIVILFHAAFQSNNLVATSTYLSLLIVVSTGIVGRFIYGLVPNLAIIAASDAYSSVCGLSTAMPTGSMRKRMEVIPSASVRYSLIRRLRSISFGRFATKPLDAA